MISPTELQELKARLRSLVVEDLAATLAALKEALPADTPRMGEVLTLEGQFQAYQKEKFRQTLSAENEQLIANQIRSQLVDLIAALEVADFTPVRQSVVFSAARKRVLLLFLALLVGGFAAIFYYWANTANPPDWFPLPNNKSGHLLYKIPAVMQLNQEELCIMRIAFDSVSLVRDLTVDDVKIEDIRTSNKMKVELVDSQAEPAFHIRNILEDDEQFIERGDYTEWRFGVTPLKTGTHNLTLKVSVMKKIGDEYVPKNLSFSKDIEIVSDPPARAEVPFENTGQIISEQSGLAMVETIEGIRKSNQGPNKGNPEPVDTAITIVDEIIVHFPLNSVQPLPATTIPLEALAERLSGTRETLVLTGHTDNTGKPGYNQSLGLRRAEAIQALLVRRGVPPARIEVRSAGETQPVATNATAAGRAQNRRVEVRVE